MRCKFAFIATVAALASTVAAATAMAAPGHGLGSGSVTSSTSQGVDLIAPPAACPGQTRLNARPRAQEQTMECMTDFARKQDGLGTLVDAEALDWSARGKARDVLRCDEFSHFACDRDFKYWMEEAGYLSATCWRVGENLAWGTNRQGSVRSIFRAWIRSPGHRVNVLGDFAQTGVALRVGALDARPRTRVWAQHFGIQCG